MPRGQARASSRAQRWLDRRARALRVAGPVAGLTIVPLVLWAFLLQAMVEQGATAEDFGTYLADAEALLSGEAMSGQPPLLAVLALPLTVLPVGVAEVVAVVAAALSAIGVLAVLGVRDWRCYAALALWAPVYTAVQTANVTLVLALGAALVWRWRDRPALTGAATAVTAALKVFLWPLALWPPATGRWRATAVTAGVGSAGAALAVAVAGSPAQIVERLLDGVAAFGAQSYAVASWFEDAGASDSLADALSWSLAAGLVAGAVLAARQGSEERSFLLLLVAALAASPIMWPHYLCVLLAPLAMASPRLRWIWFVPLPLWVCVPDDPASWQRLVFAAVAIAFVAVIARALPGARAATG